MLKRDFSLLLIILLLLSQCGNSDNRTNEPDASSGGNGAGTFPVPELPFNPRHYLVYKTDQPLQVDGKIDENAWSRVDWTDYFVDIEGHLQPDPEYNTRVKMLWDEEYFYFAAELEEPDVWGTLTERNSVIFRDNDFEIFIDPDGDTHNYFEFEINALGTIWDLFLIRPYRDGTHAINTWNLSNYKSGVHVEGEINNPGVRDTRWTVEVALPWSALRRTASGNRMPEAGDQWRVNFSRVQWRLDVVENEYRKTINPDTGTPFPESNWVWSPQGLINMHYPEKWGFVQFSDMTAGEGNEEFVWNGDEEIKWALRQVYYKQRNYQRQNGRFTENASELDIDSIQVEGFDFNPQIQTTLTMFEASSPGFDGELIWFIRNDGRIWSQ